MSERGGDRDQHVAPTSSHPALSSRPRRREGLARSSYGLPQLPSFKSSDPRPRFRIPPPPPPFRTDIAPRPLHLASRNFHPDHKF